MKSQVCSGGGANKYTLNPKVLNPGQRSLSTAPRSVGGFGSLLGLRFIPFPGNCFGAIYGSWEALGPK